MASKVTDGSTVGMMDAAYFVGKAKILSFFNDLLQINLSKIEETASGAVACQLTDYVFPGSVPMARVNWEAKSDFEFVNNYKLLQVAFKKNHVQRHVEVNKLIRAKYQDNLEFCQWLKAFVERSGVDRGDSYDPVAVREKGKGGKKFNQKMAGARSKAVGGGSRRVTTATTTTTTKPRVPTRPTPAKPTSTTRTSTTAKTTTRSMASSPNSRTKEPLKRSSSGNKVGGTNAEPDAMLLKKNAELEATVSKLEEIGIETEAKLAEAEREKDFYFEKLRNVELLLQIKQGNNFDGCDLQNVVDGIFKVLYATAEDVLEIDEDGEVVTDTNDISQQPSGLSVDDISADLNAALGGTATAENEEEEEDDDDVDQLFAENPAAGAAEVDVY
mmetsp:Transcript_19273/g.46554  ORF Transcript_19273/g.46554 Transcript_19273/m.46554 type:complete len:386 (+) Transcript_19273:143-1300(+)|eukprot:CAMPEP_0113484666 /NCGR_PEP_ID=MMETSP0014_2-20120614/24082_1 /TAXON_ID=2857 /ORGANISM="Nitzschia sp." /LENGTH=385 /DNA_ID=CAMNT_0000378281 /DNA_START=77 /DNA_END=1234 /DNA_ORIENTATION=- /assembly_acc=CAM_ASM_000159